MTTEHANIPPHLICLDPDGLPQPRARFDFHEHELSPETAARVEEHRHDHKGKKRKDLVGLLPIGGSDTEGRPIVAHLVAPTQKRLKNEAGGLYPCIIMDAHVAEHPTLAQYLRADSEWSFDFVRSEKCDTVQVQYDEICIAAHLIWEKHHGKPFPPGKAVSLEDRNVLNLFPENFKLVDAAYPYEHEVIGLADSDKTPLDAETLARVRPLQDADVPREQIKYLPVERGRLGSGTPVSLKMLSGERHPATGRLQFAISKPDLIEAVVRDRPDHAWNLNRRPNGHFVVRVKRTVSPALAPIVFAAAHGFPVPRSHVLAFPNGNPLDLRSDNLVLYRKGQGRPGGKRKD